MNWLDPAFGGDQMPNCTATGYLTVAEALTFVVMLPIVIEPETTSPATHPVALPGTDSCIRGFSSGQSVNGL